MTDYYSNKVVVITGGAGGLGRALSVALQAEGARVAALDLDVSNLSETHSLLPVMSDITSREGIKRALEVVLSHFGRIDILINNAGITHMSRFSDTSAELFDKIMSVNFNGAVDITREALPYLKSSQGQIVAISSVAGFAPLYGRSAYAASKHAMEGFFLSLASELKEHDVDVLIVSPSFVKSRPELQAQVNGGVSSPGAMKKSTNGEQLEPEVAAERIITAMEQGQRNLKLGRVAKIAYWLNALLPALYERVMVKGARTEFE